MRIAHEAHWNGAKNQPGRIDLDPYKVKFTSGAPKPPAPVGERKPGEPPRPLTKEDILKVRKAMAEHQIRNATDKRRRRGTQPPMQGV